MCDICKQDICPTRCPNYMPPKAERYCSVCGEGIYETEEYVENSDGDSIHFECVQGIKWLLEWLGYDIKTMEDFQ